jgi:hypothetical protein
MNYILPSSLSLYLACWWIISSETCSVFLRPYSCVGLSLCCFDGRAYIKNGRLNVNANESYLVKRSVRERMSESVIQYQTECAWSRNFVTVTPVPVANATSKTKPHYQKRDAEGMKLRAESIRHNESCSPVPFLNFIWRCLCDTEQKYICKNVICIEDRERELWHKNILELEAGICSPYSMTCS